MKIPGHIRATYTALDPEAAFFLDHFDEKPGSRVLEVGSHDAPVAKMLAESGFDVTGIDLRPCDYQAPACWNHRHIVADFCDWASREIRCQFDCIVSVSAIEHFGLGTYGERAVNPYYDVIAMRYVYDLLREGGVAYISVPIGGRYVELNPHWRVYDGRSLMDRIVQSFAVEFIKYGVCEAWSVGGRQLQVGDSISPEEINQNVNGFPGISGLLKLRKVARKG